MPLAGSGVMFGAFSPWYFDGPGLYAPVSTFYGPAFFGPGYFGVMGAMREFSRANGKSVNVSVRRGLNIYAFRWAHTAGQHPEPPGGDQAAWLSGILRDE